MPGTRDSVLGAGAAPAVPTQQRRAAGACGALGKKLQEAQWCRQGLCSSSGQRAHAQHLAGIQKNLLGPEKRRAEGRAGEISGGRRGSERLGEGGKRKCRSGGGGSEGMSHGAGSNRPRNAAFRKNPSQGNNQRSAISKRIKAIQGPRSDNGVSRTHKNSMAKVQSGQWLQRQGGAAVVEGGRVMRMDD
ncbi:hypothetical protein K438DRAFT_1755455 [Mycena galopus ATCC 62051]|nr:hypothetical protein K438DRAFT_1755455 [Mycena galopus ATCC 62051]